MTTVFIILIALLAGLEQGREEALWDPIRIVQQGNAQSLDILLNGPEINATNANGNTPLQISAATGNPEIAENGNTLLHIAVDADRLQMVGMIIDAGGDPNIPNRAGHTAIDIAEAKNRENILSQLKNRCVILRRNHTD